jgi:hypothetical protein
MQPVLGPTGSARTILPLHWRDSAVSLLTADDLTYRTPSQIVSRWTHSRHCEVARLSFASVLSLSEPHRFSSAPWGV